MDDRKFTEEDYHGAALQALASVTFPPNCLRPYRRIIRPKKVEVNVYNIQKKDGKTIVYDWQNGIIWSGSDGDFILYNGPNGPTADKVGNLSDAQILTALASSIKLSL